MKNSLRVAFLTSGDPLDKRSWSGINYRMLRALEEEFEEVHILGPAPDRSLSYFVLLSRIAWSMVFHSMVYRKKYNRDHNNKRSAFYANYFNKQLSSIDVDVIFAPSGSIEIALLKTPVPICYLTGSTFAQMTDYYTFFSGFSARSIKESNEIEQAAITRSRTQVFPSAWAADFARDHYQANDSYVVPHGANLEHVPESKVKRYAPGSTLQIVFIGVDWVRKGGDTVFDTFEILLERGVDLELTVCGCKPPVDHPRMTVIPFLDKNKESDLQAFNDLLYRSDLFFMPTRAENFGVVFCEANAFGIPAISTRTGGTTSAIEEGVNGHTLPLEASAAEFADLIESLARDEQRFTALSKSSRRKYLDELNWEHWGKQMRLILQHTADQK
jgi:glycosyltransferase involved in cell wall biosynthesis